MPELPEVEVIRGGLDQLITGKSVKNLEVLNPKSFQASRGDADAFLIEATIKKVRRRGKVLLIDLSSNYTLMIHLKMTGQMLIRGSETFAGGHPSDSMISNLPDRHTRVAFELSDNMKLFFNDMRKFGWVKLMPTSEIKNENFIAKIGPEPLIGDPFPEYLKRISNHRRTVIKAALLNQQIVAGIGNIYADEALWGAKIHPETRVAALDEIQLQDILQAAIDVMSLSIKKGGSTDRNYVNAKGERGSYLEFANVFRREGKPCNRCGVAIEKIRVAGRGTHICPVCQQIKGDR